MFSYKRICQGHPCCTQQPLCISRLVIAPKFAPGQEKSDPDHGFKVCVNALVNKCLKPYGSTIPLAVDEIKKLYGYKYYLGVDGFSAYILEHSGLRGKQNAHSISHSGWNILLEQTHDGRNS